MIGAEYDLDVVKHTRDGPGRHKPVEKSPKLLSRDRGAHNKVRPVPEAGNARRFKVPVAPNQPWNSAQTCQVGLNIG